MAKLAHLLLAATALCTLVSALPAPADDIPVAVLLEDVDLDNEIKRPAIDLRNPGPPQRQEHETQNPEHFSEDILKLISVKENFENTQESLRQGFQGVTDDLQKWITNNEQLNVIQQNLQNLRETFTNQIQKLNETLQGFVSGQPAQQVDQAGEKSQIQRDFNKVESRLKSLQDNFRSNVNTLSEGVQIVASLKSNQSLRQSDEVTNPPQNLLVQYATYVQNTATNGFNSLQHAVTEFFSNNPAVTGLQNIFNPNNVTTATGELADTPEGTTTTTTTQRPLFPWQNFNLNNFNLPSFANLFNQGQNSQTNQQGGNLQVSETQQQQGGPLGLLTGLIPQNIPNPFQNLFPRPPNNAAQPAATPVGNNAVPEPAKPAEPAPAKPAEPAPAPEGQAVQPVEPAQSVEPAQPEAAAAADAPVTLPPPPVGPIRQILNSIPVVQRIQNTIQQNSKPDTPRDTVKSENIETKGHYGYGGYNNNNNGGDNNDSSRVKSEPIPSEKVPKPEQPKPVKEEAPAPAPAPSPAPAPAPAVADKTE